MTNHVSTMFTDIGILLALVAISLGIWFYPWVTLILLALLLVVGFLTHQGSGS